MQCQGLCKHLGNALGCDVLLGSIQTKQVAPYARHHHARAKSCVQLARHGTQHGITKTVIQHVVDVSKAIEIQQGQHTVGFGVRFQVR